MGVAGCRVYFTSVFGLVDKIRLLDSTEIKQLLEGVYRVLQQLVPRCRAAVQYLLNLGGCRDFE